LLFKDSDRCQCQRPPILGIFDAKTQVDVIHRESRLSAIRQLDNQGSVLDGDFRFTNGPGDVTLERGFVDLVLAQPWQFQVEIERFVQANRTARSDYQIWVDLGKTGALPVMMQAPIKHLEVNL
jgi:hypothetical protein